jgi:hypothetical protein
MRLICDHDGRLAGVGEASFVAYDVYACMRLICDHDGRLVGVGEASFVALAAPFIDDAVTCLAHSIFKILKSMSFKLLGL